MVKDLLERERWGCNDKACQIRWSKTQGSSQALTERLALVQDTFANEVFVQLLSQLYHGALLEN